MSQNPSDLYFFTGDSLLGELLVAHFNESSKWRIRLVRESDMDQLSTPVNIVVDFRSSETLGVDFVKSLLNRWPGARCFLLSNGYTESLVRLFRRFRVAGLFDKNSGLTSLRDALNLFVDGGFYLSAGLDKYWSSESVEETRNLTNREIEILTLVSRGLKSPEISRRLTLSVKTVHNHRANMMRKVGVRNVAQLVNYAHQNHLVSNGQGVAASSPGSVP